jgi:hypothetical protein
MCLFLVPWYISPHSSKHSSIQGRELTGLAAGKTDSLTRRLMMGLTVEKSRLLAELTVAKEKSLQRKAVVRSGS